MALNGVLINYGGPHIAVPKELLIRLSFPDTLSEVSFRDQLNMAASKRWNVYAKRPFAGVDSIIVYMGRYTHRVAISLKRITAVGQSGVTFDYKNYREGVDCQASEMEGVEFVRRFLRHVLPRGFQRIRYYGCCRAEAVKQIGQGLSEQWLKLARRIEALAAVLLQLPPPEESVGLPCPRCHEAILQPAGFCLFAPWDTS